MTVLTSPPTVCDSNNIGFTEGDMVCEGDGCGWYGTPIYHPPCVTPTPTPTPPPTYPAWAGNCVADANTCGTYMPFHYSPPACGDFTTGSMLCDEWEGFCWWGPGTPAYHPPCPTPTSTPIPTTCDGGTHCPGDSAAFSGLGLVTINDPYGTEVTNSLVIGTASFPACPSSAGQYTYHMNILWSGCYICSETCSTPTPTLTPESTPTGNQTIMPTPTQTMPVITFPTTGNPDQITVANFTGTPLTGPAPLTVSFMDTSTHSPIAWSWSFGDGGTSTAQNPSHTYADTGTYTVRMTAANSAGADTEEKAGYVGVTPATVNYYVFADGVALYHGLDGNLDLPGADTTAQYFYNQMTTGQNRCLEYEGTNYCWNGRNNPVNDDTGSRYWSKTESADSIGANSAEFAFHVGHGWKNGIVFGTFNSNKNVTRSDMQFSRAKWVAFNSCEVVNQSRQYDWGSVFDGAHIIMGFDTWGIPKTDQGPQFVERMRGGSYQGNPYLVTKIRDAWRYTMQATIQDSTLNGAYVWAEPSQDDYLPGYGPFIEPTKTNGQYALQWESFVCN
ncbi:MAG: DUF6345 domain-containing protein [Methanoregula sp.]|nr:DUF6345 domain-containing protein [Methanoregula sp.]